MKIPLDQGNRHLGILRRMCAASWPKRLKTGPKNGPRITC